MATLPSLAGTFRNGRNGIAQQIVEDLEAALSQFAMIAADLKQ
jgi:hypothetical protein